VTGATLTFIVLLIEAVLCVYQGCAASRSGFSKLGERRAAPFIAANRLRLAQYVM
jgi:hypothetical protein